MLRLHDLYELRKVIAQVSSKVFEDQTFLRRTILAKEAKYIFDMF